MFSDLNSGFEENQGASPCHVAGNLPIQTLWLLGSYQLGHQYRQ